MRSPTRSPTRSPWPRPQRPAAPRCEPAPRRGDRATGDGASADRRHRRAPLPARPPSTAPACAPTRSPGWSATTSFEIYPRKGEFFVFDPPDGIRSSTSCCRSRRSGRRGCSSSRPSTARSSPGPPPTTRTTRTTGPSAPRPGTRSCAKVVRALPPLEGAEPIASYAGLRPAGRGVNYVIGPSAGCERLINVAAIRSTGSTASLGIGEYVAACWRTQGVELGEERALPARRSRRRTSRGGNEQRDEGR